MIDAFRRIGEELLKDFENYSEIDRKKAVLGLVSNKIKTQYYDKKKNENVELHEFIINLNTKIGEVEIKKGNQLTSDKNNYLAFTKTTSNGPKFMFSTTVPKYLLKNTIPDLVNFIENKIVNTAEYKDFLTFLRELNDNFFVSDDKGVILQFDNEKLSEKKLSDYIIENFNENKESSQSLYTLTINGKRISETEYFKDYIKLKYLEIVEYKFSDKVKEQGFNKKELISHVSGNKEIIAKAISLPTAFFTTTDNIYFENLSNSASRKSFSMGFEDYEKISVGIKYIQENFSRNILGLQCLFIPTNEISIRNLKYGLKGIDSFLKDQREKKRIIGTEYIVDKLKNCSYQMIFYEQNNNEFAVFSIIPSITLKDLNKIEKVQENIGDLYEELFSVENYIYNHISRCNLNSFWNSLYSYINKNGGKDKIKIYRKEFLSYLNSLFSFEYIDYPVYLNKTLKNLRVGYFNSKFKEERKKSYFGVNETFDILNMIQFFNKLNMIEIKKGEVGKMFINNLGKENDLEKFFELHKEIFGDDINGEIRKALIGLGTQVNKIQLFQKDRRGSATFIQKINFSGMGKEDIFRLMNEVENYFGIYPKEKKLFKDEKLFAYIKERFLIMEKSDISREEVTYYVLLGNSLGAAIGLDRAKKSSDEPKSLEVEN